VLVGVDDKLFNRLYVYEDVYVDVDDEEPLKLDDSKRC
jgi:hypothetical protein